MAEYAHTYHISVLFQYLFVSCDLVVLDVVIFTYHALPNALVSG